MRSLKNQHKKDVRQKFRHLKIKIYKSVPNVNKLCRIMSFARKF